MKVKKKKKKWQLLFLNTLKQYLTQETLFLSLKCSLHCFNCPLDNPKLTDHIQIQKKELLSKVKNQIDSFNSKKIVNIIGGDPIFCTELVTILKKLNTENHYCRLWTTGIESELNYKQVLTYVNEVFLFLPSGDEENYRDLTGRDYLELVKSRLSFFKEETIQLSLNCPVNSVNFSFLPEVYDLIFEQNIPLYLHIPDQSKLPKDALAWVERFHSSELVTVINTKQKKRSKNDLCCPMTPFHPNLSLSEKLSLGWTEYWRPIIKKYGPSYFLKRHFG